MGALTFSTCISLHKLVRGAGILELGWEPCELRKHLVDDSHLGSKVIIVDVKGEEAADIAQASNNKD